MIISHNIISVIEKKLCMGCGTCAGICPQNAIKIEFNKSSGEFIPSVKSDLCNQCGLCLDSCPGPEIDLGGACFNLWGKYPQDARIGHYLSGYMAHSLDEHIRYISSSGGMITALVNYALDNDLIDGALVTRMKNGVAWMPEPFIARERDEIISAAGSKYCPVPVNLGLREIINREGRYAVVGLPCQIYGLRLAQRRIKVLRQRVVMTFGLFCGGGRTFKGTEAFLRQCGISLKDVEKMSYRGQGWPGMVEIISKDHRRILCTIESAYPFMCMNDVHRCSFCPDKSAELSDVSFGDLWLAQERNQIGAGKSVCVARSMEGQALLQAAATDGAVCLQGLDREKIAQTAKPYDKKVAISARLFCAAKLGVYIPVLKNSGIERHSAKDVLKAIKYYMLQELCRHKFLQETYFRLWVKYRRAKKDISITSISDSVPADQDEFHVNG